MAMLNNQSVHHCILSLYMVMKCREGKAIFAKPEGIAGILEVEEIKLLKCVESISRKNLIP